MRRARAPRRDLSRGRSASTDVAPRRPSLISDTEAQSIIGRAADLQARTGIEPRPAPVAMRRDAERDAARTSGYKPADIRDAAVEAGISAKYVDHVLEEHGLAPSAPLESRSARARRSQSPQESRSPAATCTSSTRSSSTARCRRATTIFSSTSSASDRRGRTARGRRPLVLLADASSRSATCRSRFCRAAERRRFRVSETLRQVAGATVRRHRGRLRRRDVGHLDRDRRQHAQLRCSARGCGPGTSPRPTSWRADFSDEAEKARAADSRAGRAVGRAGSRVDRGGSATAQRSAREPRLACRLSDSRVHLDGRSSQPLVASSGRFLNSSSACRIRQRVDVLHRPAVHDVAHRELGDLAADRPRNVGHLR